MVGYSPIIGDMCSCTAATISTVTVDGCSCEAAIGGALAPTTCDNISGPTPLFLVINITGYTATLNPNGVYFPAYNGACSWVTDPSSTWPMIASVDFDGTDYHLHVRIDHIIFPLHADYDFVLGPAKYDGVTEVLIPVQSQNIEVLPVPNPADWKSGIM